LIVWRLVSRYVIFGFDRGNVKAISKARRSRKEFRARLVLPLAAVLLLATAAYLAADIRPSATPLFGTGTLSIPISDLRAGEVKFFSYRSDPAGEIRFLLARDSDGHLHGALDACQSCYTYHRGFRSSGGYLICRVCGNRYKLDKLTTGIASCSPVNLKYQNTGKTVQIKTSDLKGAGSFF
jgi:uncharacterized membrane protein